MCSCFLLSSLTAILVLLAYFMFRYRVRYISFKHEFDYSKDLLNSSEKELNELKAEYAELQCLNQLHELKAKVRQADLKHRLGER